MQISHQCYSHSAFPYRELTCTPLLSFSTLLCLHFALLEILLTAAVTLTPPGSGCPHWHLGRWACFPRLTRWTPLMNKIMSQAANKGDGRRSFGCVLPGRTHRVVVLTVFLLQTNQGAQVFLCQIKRWNKHLMTGWRWRMCWDSNSWDNPYNQHRGDVTTEPPGGGAFTAVLVLTHRQLDARDGAETWSRTDRWSRARQEGRRAGWQKQEPTRSATGCLSRYKWWRDLHGWEDDLTNGWVCECEAGAFLSEERCDRICFHSYVLRLFFFFFFKWCSTHVCKVSEWGTALCSQSATEWIFGGIFTKVVCIGLNQGKQDGTHFLLVRTCRGYLSSLFLFFCFWHVQHDLDLKPNCLFFISLSLGCSVSPPSRPPVYVQQVYTGHSVGLFVEHTHHSANYALCVIDIGIP